MRRIAATFREETPPRVHRVISIENLAAEWDEELRFVVLISADESQQVIEQLCVAGLSNVSWVKSDSLEVGDVVSPQSEKDEVLVLFRESDLHHSLLLTNRCNSYCIMCSQPPTKHNDAWLVEEALDVIRHIRVSPPVLGLSGGEPLLLGSDLRKILNAVTAQHPSTRVDVLTNGRLFHDVALANEVLHDLHPNVTWLVPLYGHADFVHDFVVQTYGAFEETLAGLLALQEYQQPIQLRIVLIEPVLRVLPELCRFIGRNFPFVREVALMACEPIGFSLANREHCEVDLLQWTESIEQSARELRRYQIPYLFMNTPLCALPKHLWPDAHRSISDWKNVYAQECSGCSVKGQCSGLFAWHESGWRPTKIRAIVEEQV